MRKILLIGAGRSASNLIQYLLEKSYDESLFLTVGDLHLSAASALLNNHPNAEAIFLDINDTQQRRQAISQADIVISMLPAHLHMEVAKDCLHYKKNMVTASYISPDMQALDAEVRKAGLIFMNETGVDPGIDHMSAMEVIDRIQGQGGKIILFESFCGGLIAPESDTNLWNYKFTWNPRNVVLAGQGGAAEFIQEGRYKYIPYHRLFRRTEFLDVEGYGRFEGYANRNSLKYREIYGLEDVLTLYRGTLRRVGFSRAWNMFVSLGMTDDSYQLRDTETMSYREFVNLFLPYSPTDSVELKMRHNLKIDQDDLMWDKLVELDIFNPDKIIGIPHATPAQCLQKILMDQWTLQSEDKDMVVMYHKFGYQLDGEKKQIDSKMVVVGDNQTYTAMSKTVGLPVAIITLLILNQKITTPGVQLPIKKEVYQPVLEELKTFGIYFNEYATKYTGYNPNNVY
jgi:saccharopine dehydrogenase-like NADP-dependent oxidoreductase